MLSVACASQLQSLCATTKTSHSQVNKQIFFLKILNTLYPLSKITLQVHEPRTTACEIFCCVHFSQGGGPMLSLFLTRYIFPKPQTWRLILNQRCTLTSTLKQDVRKWFSNTSKGGVPHGSRLSGKKIHL